MKTFTITADQALQRGSLECGFALVKDMKKAGVPVVGVGWPWSVREGYLLSSFDETFGDFTFTWQPDWPAFLDENKVEKISADMREAVNSNPTHVAHLIKIKLACVLKSPIPIGASWPMGLEEGAVIISYYDEMFDDIYVSWGRP